MSKLLLKRKNESNSNRQQGFYWVSLVPSLINDEHEVIELDVLNGDDITDWNQVMDINDFDVIIHLAAISYVPKSYEIPREMYSVNIIGTLNMLELCRINKAKMIFTSSYIYGEPEYLPIDEKHPVSAFNPYCQSKLIGEKLCESYHKDFGVPTIIFRPFNIYGPGQNIHFLIPSIKRQIEENNQVQLNDPMPKRDFVHVDDVVSAYNMAIEYRISDFEIFNIGSGKSYSAREVAELMISAFSKDVKLEFSGEQRKNEILDTIADITKVQRKLDWKPTISIEDGIARL